MLVSFNQDRHISTHVSEMADVQREPSSKKIYSVIKGKRTMDMLIGSILRVGSTNYLLMDYCAKKVSHLNIMSS